MPVGSRFTHVHARAPSFSSRVDEASRKPPSPQSPTKDRFAMIPSYCRSWRISPCPAYCTLFGGITGGEKGGKESPEANSKIAKKKREKNRAPRSTTKQACSRPRKTEGMIMRAPSLYFVPRREGRVRECAVKTKSDVYISVVYLLAVDKLNSHSSSRDGRQRNRGNFTFQAFNFWSRDASRIRKVKEKPNT
ncbi:hypothetical protein PspLS_06599 [Pyricularia sp. CBS 133598]|nr:hypothetical protein PspLS_06599 [Pyricularia sp. CBS 133598]